MTWLRKNWRRPLAGFAVTAGLGLGVVFGLSAWAGSDDPSSTRPPVAVAVAPVALPAAPAAAAAPALPIKDVVLFSSGVAYFERGGQVTGNAAAELKFKVGDINDLLKSLMVLDLSEGKGRVSVVTYGSRDPLAKTLRSFAVDLTSDVTMGGLLNQVRGERVAITSPTSTFEGVIISVEKKSQQLKDGSVIVVELLTLHTADGLRTVSLDQIQKIKLLNAELDTELQQALAVLATGHDTQKKTVGFQFVGEGVRDIRIGYVTENPVWKTSYRLLADRDNRLFLQGWAIVENTGDDDWNDVRLTMVSGRPISFIQDLYQPLYVPRPEVQTELYASLRPQLYEGGTPQADSDPRLAWGEAKAANEAEQLSRRVGRAPSAPPAASLATTQSKLDTDAIRKLDEYRLNASASAAVAQATGSKLGDTFRYTIDTPIKLPRRKSAMIPIISGPVEGERLSIYNASVQPKHPLSGLRLKNSTKAHLSSGPITVYADGIYGGDARIDDVRPDETRLISYGIDLAVAVNVASKPTDTIQLAAKLRRGVLHITRRATDVRTYEIRNADTTQARKVLVEHPLRSDWTLKSPEKYEEKTGSVYRFPVVVPAAKTVTLEVREEKQLDETVSLSSQAVSSIGYYLRSLTLSPELRAQLEKVVALKNEQDALIRKANLTQQKLNEAVEEQQRVKSLMTGLPTNGDLYQRYITKLGQLEDSIEQWRPMLVAEREAAQAKLQEIEKFLLTLNVD